MICPRSHTKYWISQYSRLGLLNPTLVFLEAEHLWKGGGGGGGGPGPRSSSDQAFVPPGMPV